MTSVSLVRGLWFACHDLNLGPHPYQRNVGNRCADRQSCRSLTVGTKVMRSISPMDALEFLTGRFLVLEPSFDCLGSMKRATIVWLAQLVLPPRPYQVGQSPNDCVDREWGMAGYCHRQLLTMPETEVERPTIWPCSVYCGLL